VVGGAEHVAVVVVGPGGQYDDAAAHLRPLEPERDGVRVDLAAHEGERRAVQLGEQQRARHNADGSGAYARPAHRDHLGEPAHAQAGEQREAEVGEHRAARRHAHVAEDREQVVADAVEEEVPAERVEEADRREDEPDPEGVAAARRRERLEEVRVRRAEARRVRDPDARRDGQRQHRERALRGDVAEDAAEVARPVEPDGEERGGEGEEDEGVEPREPPAKPARQRPAGAPYAAGCADAGLCKPPLRGLDEQQSRETEQEHEQAGEELEARAALHRLAHPEPELVAVLGRQPVARPRRVGLHLLDAPLEAVELRDDVVGQHERHERERRQPQSRRAPAPELPVAPEPVAR
jgi:hypothetical protein